MRNGTKAKHVFVSQSRGSSKEHGFSRELYDFVEIGAVKIINSKMRHLLEEGNFAAI
jgi:hypothetical protein